MILRCFIKSFFKHVVTFTLILLLLLLFTRPFPRDGGMAEDHGAPEAGQLPTLILLVVVILFINIFTIFEKKIDLKF